MDRNELIEAQRQAAQALEAGRKMAARWAAEYRGEVEIDRPAGAALGALLGNPSAFWAGATTCASFGDGDVVAPLAASVKYASARLAVGDFDFVRESLLGQAAWLSAVAVKTEASASREKDVDRMAAKMKLAMMAQRQAMQALATAAALNRIDGAQTVTVGD